MSLISRCAHYCERYGECWRVLWALKAYESVHGEKHPAERALMPYGDPPPCLVPKREPVDETGTDR